MRHQSRGRTLSRRREHRRAMLSNLAASLIKNGRVKTTDAKAKEVRPFVERMVTFAKRGDLHARRIVLSRLKDPGAVKKLFEEFGPKYADRSGGYTRILKLGFRQGDNSPISLIEFVGTELVKPASKTDKKKARPKKGEAAGKETLETGQAEETEEVAEETADEVEADESEEKAGDADEEQDAGETSSGDVSVQSDGEEKNG